MTTTKEKIEVMQAYEDGKEIQCSMRKLPDNPWNDCTQPAWNWDSFDYRIKPEEPKPTYRPYKNVDEMVEDFQERFSCYYITSWTMPLIWVKHKRKSTSCLITGLSKHEMILVGDEWMTQEKLLDDYNYLDGTPCGKLVEE